MSPKVGSIEVMNDEKLNDSPKIEEKKLTVDKPKVSSRKERKKRKQQEQNSEQTPKKTLWVQIRILPIWLRLILIILLLAIVIIIGLRVGYGYIGDGNPADVLKKETWMHILDIIQGKE